MLHRHQRPLPGESAPFHFESRWLLRAPLAEVWEEFAAVATWPRWWPGVAAAAETASGDATGAGTHVALTVRSPLTGPVPVRGLTLALSVAEADPPHGARVAVTGDLRGHGEWRARQVAGLTRVDIVWCVVTTRPLLRTLRPLSAAAHRSVMRGGERGLAEQLGAYPETHPWERS